MDNLLVKPFLAEECLLRAQALIRRFTELNPDSRHRHPRVCQSGYSAAVFRQLVGIYEKIERSDIKQMEQHLSKLFYKIAVEQAQLYLLPAFAIELPYVTDGKLRGNAVSVISEKGFFREREMILDGKRFQIRSFFTPEPCSNTARPLIFMVISITVPPFRFLGLNGGRGERHRGIINAKMPF